MAIDIIGENMDIIKQTLRTVSRPQTSSSLLFGGVGDLPTLYEWLAEEKELDLKWLHPGSVLDNDIENDYNDDGSINRMKEMPLYPLEACYLLLPFKNKILNAWMKKIIIQSFEVSNHKILK